MPPVPAHTQDDDPGSDADLWAGDRPISLSDIDQVLGESAGVERAGDTAPLRPWRDELTLALESLACARLVLAADVGILRHCLAGDGTAEQTVVDALPAVMASRSWGDGWSASCATEGGPWVDPEVFVRSGELMSAHQEMACTDLTAPEDVARVLGLLEAQLLAITERQDPVRIRLQEIRAAIVRQYQEGSVRLRDWLV